MPSAQLHGGGPERGLLAILVLAPHLELDVLAVDFRDPAATSVRLVRHVDAAIAHLERFQRAPVADPVGEQLAKVAGLQQAVQDDARQVDAAREILVVMDLVEVARRAGVLHQLARRRVLDEPRDLLAGLHRRAHRRIAVPRSRATVRPCWLVYSVSKMMNSRFPLEPLFSYTSPTLPVAVILSPTFTGSRYSKRLPPFSQPLPYCSASSRWYEVGAIATRKVGGASSSQRGVGAPVASANRLR